MLKYNLTENPLTERPDDYSAQTHSVTSLDKEAVITRILNLGTLLTRTDIIAVLNGLEEVVVGALHEGCNVTLPLFNTSFSVSGVFESPSDSFDANRHKLNINLSRGVLLRNAEKTVKFEKTNAPAPQPNILEVKDSMTGSVNEKLTAKGVVEMYGYNLKIEGNDPACGLWFINDAGNETKVERIIKNKPTRIIALIPDLDKGDYRIKIVTRFSNGGKPLKMPKTFVYPQKFRIEGDV